MNVVTKEQADAWAQNEMDRREQTISDALKRIHDNEDEYQNDMEWLLNEAKDKSVHRFLQFDAWSNKFGSLYIDPTEVDKDGDHICTNETLDLRYSPHELTVRVQISESATKDDVLRQLYKVCRALEAGVQVVLPKDIADSDPAPDVIFVPDYKDSGYLIESACDINKNPVLEAYEICYGDKERGKRRFLEDREAGKSVRYNGKSIPLDQVALP